MAPSSASVFFIDGWLFWGFDDNRNNAIVIAYFVDRNGTISAAFAMVVIVHLASVVKPLLLFSLLYSQTSSLLFSVLKLFVFFVCENTINVFCFSVGCLMKSVLFCTTMINSYKMQKGHWSMSVVNFVSRKKLKQIWLMCGYTRNCAKLAATMWSLF